MSPEGWMYAAIGAAGVIVLLLTVLTVAIPGAGRNARTVEQELRDADRIRL